MLASASQAIIVGFQVDIDPAARRMADSERVDIRVYQIIYKLIEDVELALRGLLEPTYVDVEIGARRSSSHFQDSTQWHCRWLLYPQWLGAAGRAGPSMAQ